MFCVMTSQEQIDQIIEENPNHKWFGHMDWSLIGVPYDRKHGEEVRYATDLYGVTMDYWIDICQSIERVLVSRWVRELDGVDHDSKYAHLQLFLPLWNDFHDHMSRWWPDQLRTIKTYTDEDGKFPGIHLKIVGAMISFLRRTQVNLWLKGHNPDRVQADLDAKSEKGSPPFRYYVLEARSSSLDRDLGTWWILAQGEELAKESLRGYLPPCDIRLQRLDWVGIRRSYDWSLVTYPQEHLCVGVNGERFPIGHKKILISNTKER